MKKIFCFILVFVCCQIKSQTSGANFSLSLNSNSVTATNLSVYTGTGTPFYIWDTGDGTTYTTTSLSQTVSHTYSVNGTSIFQLSIYDQSGFWHLNYDSIYINVPGCSLSVTTSESKTLWSDAAVAFSNTVLAQTGPVTFFWEFGDGNSSTNATPNYTYLENGLYTYSLTVTESPTCIARCQINGYGIATNFYVHGGVCTYTPSLLSNQQPGGVVTFTIDKMGPKTEYAWVFGDGDANYNSKNTSHIYFNGVYSATLVATILPCGQLFFYSTVTVTDNPCVINSGYTYTASSGGQINFSPNSLSSSTNMVYYWDFGDGTFSSIPNPIHTYSSSGSFYASLTTANAANSVGCQQISTQTVTVSGIPCVPISTFNFYASQNIHEYILNVTYPYNIANLDFDWGDGSNSNFLFGSHTYSAAGNYSICMSVTASCGSASTSCLNQYVSKGTAGDIIKVTVLPWGKATGIKEQSRIETNSIRIFPNPATDILNIENDDPIEAYKIFDLMGGELSIFNSKTLSSPSNSIDLSGIENGIYILTITDKKGKHNSRFVVTK